MNYRLESRGFTLTEALITMVLIGVVAALTIPAVLINTEQNEYKSSLKKALYAINQVIELNIALEGYGPVEVDSSNMLTNDNSLYNFFRRRMNVISTSDSYKGGSSAGNVAFFTADGMRYEFPASPSITGFSPTNSNCARPGEHVEDSEGNSADKPCLLIVDVNGDKKPNPISKTGAASYKIPSAQTSRSKILDVFPIVVTDINAYPYGVVAQRAMFQHD